MCSLGIHLNTLPYRSTDLRISHLDIANICLLHFRDYKNMLHSYPNKHITLYRDHFGANHRMFQGRSHCRQKTFHWGKINPSDVLLTSNILQYHSKNKEFNTPNNQLMRSKSCMGMYIQDRHNYQLLKGPRNILLNKLRHICGFPSIIHYCILCNSHPSINIRSRLSNYSSNNHYQSPRKFLFHISAHK